MRVGRPPTDFVRGKPGTWRRTYMAVMFGGAAAHTVFAR